MSKHKNPYNRMDTWSYSDLTEDQKKFFDALKNQNPKLVTPKETSNVIESVKHELRVTSEENYQKFKRRVSFMYLGGILQICWLVINLYFYEELLKIYTKYIGYDAAGFLVFILGVSVGIILFFRGYFMFKFARYGEWPEEFKYNIGALWGDLQQINQHNTKEEEFDRIKDYANNVAKFSSRKEAAEIMTKVGAIDSISNSEQGMRTKEYINSVVRFKSRKEGFAFLTDLFK